MVGLWYYNQSGATELLIMRDFNFGLMCFKLYILGFEKRLGRGVFQS